MEDHNQIDLLNKHTKIGIDIDHTLINGPKSLLLQSYIRRHQGNKEFHLVTFRNGLDLEMVEHDLNQNGIPISWFKSLNGSPPDLFVKYWDWMQKVGHIKNNPKKLLRALKHHKIDSEELERLARVCALWKGLKCKELGCTALVDDLAEFVLPGCQLHGIEFVNSLKL